MTLIELIITMAIMLLLCTICFPKDNMEKYAINSFCKQLCSDIRYVRRCNMLEDNSAYIIYVSENNQQGYSLKKNGEFIKTVLLPMNTKISYSAEQIKFTVSGAPYSGVDTIIVKNKKYNKEITIVPVSGRVLLKEG